jgi:small subunit ribosomal protein S20
VANHPSAEKRNRQRVKRTDRNRAVTSTVRTLVKRVRTAIHAKDAAAAQTALKVATVALDKAATKGVLHSKAVSRTISRLTAQVHRLGK